MSRIRPAWTPNLTDQSGDFTIGHQWSTSQPVTVEGAWYYLPAGTDPPTALTAILYLAATQAVLASGAGGAPSLGWTFVAFAAPFEASAATNYVTAVQTNGRYGFDLDDLANPITDPDHGVVTIPAGGGRFEFGHVFPGSSGDFMHGADTEFTVGATPAEGAAAFSVGLQLAAAGARDSAGAGNAGLGLALAAAGARDSAGAAGYGLGLHLAATGARPSLGEAHFVLGLALAGPAATVTPGVLTAGGSGPILAADGISPQLAAAGTSPTLTTGGQP